MTLLKTDGEKYQSSNSSVRKFIDDNGDPLKWGGIVYRTRDVNRNSATRNLYHSSEGAASTQYIYIYISLVILLITVCIANEKSVI